MNFKAFFTGAFRVLQNDMWRRCFKWETIRMACTFTILHHHVETAYATEITRPEGLEVTESVNSHKNFVVKMHHQKKKKKMLAYPFAFQMLIELLLPHQIMI